MCFWLPSRNNEEIGYDADFARPQQAHKRQKSVIISCWIFKLSWAIVMRLKLFELVCIDFVNLLVCGKTIPPPARGRPRPIAKAAIGRPGVHPNVLLSLAQAFNFGRSE